MRGDGRGGHGRTARDIVRSLIIHTNRLTIMELDMTLRNRRIADDLLHRMQDTSRPFDLSAFMCSNQLAFRTVATILDRMEHAGTIRRTRATQMLPNGGKLIQYPVFELAVRKEELPESLPAPDADDLGSPMECEWTYLSEAM